jgi:D-alanyl-lipoteichoic acid acyltransferase DltB (MBOAT superfamily)
MLFSSIDFVFLFLPIVLAGFFAAATVVGRKAAVVWLILASLFFYGWWNPVYLILLIASIAFNYTIASAMASSTAETRRKTFLLAGIAGDLTLLGYYKYAHFFAGIAEHVSHANWHLPTILLPLGISFFTFTQIAFLVDTYKDKSGRYSLANYVLFVTYFPHLIAGPIIHHKEMMPQSERFSTRLEAGNFSSGLTTFLLGLFKKVLIADTVAAFANPVFDAAHRGVPITLVEAWIGALAFTLQLYFDFSGYSDMAVGLGRMFNLRLPINFDSPYRSTSIIEFWRRWHITLSRFLRDYLYIPLGGNRKGEFRRYVNLMATMLIGGLWHGAGWTFVLWGGLHGVYLTINHLWRRQIGSTSLAQRLSGRGGRLAGGILTFLSVVVGWVFFRAESWNGALVMLRGMIGLNGISLPTALAGHLAPLLATLHIHGISFTGSGVLSGNVVQAFVLIPALLAVAWFVPDTMEWMAKAEPALNKPDGRSRWHWRPSPIVALVLGVLFFAAAPTKFLYYNF